MDLSQRPARPQASGVSGAYAVPRPVEELASRALAHDAVRHPFLEALGSGAFGARTHDVARTFALWYDGYSRWFPRYLNAVIERLESPRHRELLSENLAEEQGRLDPDERDTLIELGIDPATVDGVPHPQLFARFCRAVGLTDAERSAPPEATIEWRSAFHGMLRAGSQAYAVGALGLGTETIVSTIYPRILQGFRRVPNLTREDLVFFELHCHVDDQHQVDLLEIAADLAAAPGGLAELERGMYDALDLRVNFWDQLHANALERPVVHHD